MLELGSQAQGWHPHQADASERIVRRLLRAGVSAPLILVTVRQWCGRSANAQRAQAWGAAQF